MYQDRFKPQTPITKSVTIFCLILLMAAVFYGLTQALGYASFLAVRSLLP